MLATAADAGHVDIVRFLLADCGDVVDVVDVSVVAAATANSHDGIVGMFRAQELVAACRGGDMEWVVEDEKPLLIVNHGPPSLRTDHSPVRGDCHRLSGQPLSRAQQLMQTSRSIKVSRSSSTQCQAMASFPVMPELLVARAYQPATPAAFCSTLFEFSLKVWPSHRLASAA